jgi:hypothetical protein
MPDLQVASKHWSQAERININSNDVADIYHLDTIKANKPTVFKAITTKEGLSKWWLPDTIAKPEIGFVNEFKVGTMFTNKMKIIDLKPNEYVE